MAQRLRIDIENGLYYITCRGWQRGPIVRDDRDGQRWLELLDRVATRCGWRIFAWALMPNHYHLYLHILRPNLSAGMHGLNSEYAIGFNRRWRRCGPLFQGRFKAVLMEDQSHALELSRYIHLNPVRASIVKEPEKYAWSSYQDYLGMRGAPAWLDWKTVVGELAKRPSRARSAYRRFVEAGVVHPPQSPLEAAVGGMFLGSAAWIDRWRRRLAADPGREDVPPPGRLAWRPALEDIAEVVAEAFDVETAELWVSRRPGNDARSAAIYLARRATDEGVGAIAAYFGGVSIAAVSKAVARAESRRQTDSAWDRRLAQLSKRLQRSGDARRK